MKNIVLIFGVIIVAFLLNACAPNSQDLRIDSSELGANSSDFGFGVRFADIECESQIIVTFLHKNFTKTIKFIICISFFKVFLCKIRAHSFAKKSNLF